MAAQSHPMRTEKDHLGACSLPEDALYGIHSIRARENFPGLSPFYLSWYKALGTTKLACYQTCKRFYMALGKKYGHKKLPLKLMNDKQLEALMIAAAQVSKGEHFDHFIVPALSGGAGTSINMNINEIITNVALMHLGKAPGQYSALDPVDHANVFQSTNDVVPTALKVATGRLLDNLEEMINQLRSQLEKLERTNSNYVKTGYTQMQAAVPTSFGKLFANYNEALARDWWRVSRCFERIKAVNLGGSAIGTGITVPRFFLMEVVKALRQLTGHPFARSDNLTDTTSNLDVFVEVHATLKAHAVNLEKMAADLRIISADMAGTKELEIPVKQTGSSIMPGKNNPVIPEYVISIAHKVYANDMLISNLAGQGCLDLNPYIPLLGHSLLDSLQLLISANKTLKDNLIKGITVHQEAARKKLFHSPAITTALIPLLGYQKTETLAHHMSRHKVDIFQANRELDVVNEALLKEIVQPHNLLKAGYTIDDLLKFLEKKEK